MTEPGVLDLSLADYATLVGRAGVDPDAEVRRFDGTDPAALSLAAQGYRGAGTGMDEAWTRSWAAQARLAEAYTNDGSPVYDRATHDAALPAGFRDAGSQLDMAGSRLGAVATCLVEESAAARRRLGDLHADVATRAGDWAAQVAAAGLIPADQVQAWRAARDRVEAVLVSMIVDAHTAVRGSVTRYEGVIASAIAGLSEQGFGEPAAAAPAESPVPPGEPPVLAGLGTPVHAGYAADPVNTALATSWRSRPTSRSPARPPASPGPAPTTPAPRRSLVPTGPAGRPGQARV